MANDNRYVSKNTFTHIWQQIVSKFVKKETFNEKIEEIQDSIVGLANADEVYIMSEGETENDIPENTVIAVFPDEDSEEIDWTNYYTKPEINEIIIRADFKKGKSAYEVAVENGFEGSEEEWLESLNGYTPQKGIDYFDGYTPQKNVDYFDGYTPQREVDYWTPNDVASIQTYVDIIVAELVDSAPEELNTLWELANALGNDPNFATTVLNKIGEKVAKVEGKGLSTNDYTNEDKAKLNELASKDFVTKSEVEAMFAQFAKDYLGDYKWRVASSGASGYVTVKKG